MRRMARGLTGVCPNHNGPAGAASCLVPSRDRLSQDGRSIWIPPSLRIDARSRGRLDPFNLPPINLVAWMCARRPRCRRRPAQAHCSRRVLIIPRLPDEPTLKHAYLNTIGGVFLRAGRYKECIKHLRDAMATTDDGGAKQDWLLLALAYHHLGQMAEARRCLTKLPADSAAQSP